MTDDASALGPDRQEPHQRPAHAVPRALLRLVATLVLLAALWMLGLVWYAATAPDQVSEPERRTDAIVVLTGGSERVVTGIQLLAEGRADRLFVSGVHKGVETSELLRLARAPRALEERIVLGYAADSTLGNAAETAQWVARERLRSVRLVTSNYHMRRSLLEFGQALPQVEIVPHPVFPERVKLDEWWRWPGTATLITGEYNKYLAALLRQLTRPRQPAAVATKEPK